MQKFTFTANTSNNNVLPYSYMEKMSPLAFIVKLLSYLWSFYLGVISSSSMV